MVVDTRFGYPAPRTLSIQTGLDYYRKYPIPLNEKKADGTDSRPGEAQTSAKGRDEKPKLRLVLRE